MATGELRCLSSASKRIADTGVLILEFTLNSPSSERAIKAISRTNYLHAPYRKSGKITNDDLLYTLSLFALEPARFVAKYEWRPLTDLELAASGTYWKSLGDAMEIEYAQLPSAKSGWTDGLHWLEELQEWSLDYEKARMVPSLTNKRLADTHFDILTFNVPSRLLLPCKLIFSVIMGEKLQKAMMFVSTLRGQMHILTFHRYPDPSRSYSALLNALLAIRASLVRHVFLPRPDFWRKTFIPLGSDPKTGRFNSLEYLSYPWYVKPSLSRRWGPRSWITRLAGRKLPGDDGNIYKPEGWTHAELGPDAFANRGGDYMEADAKRLHATNRGSCPFG